MKFNNPIPPPANPPHEDALKEVEALTKLLVATTSTKEEKLKLLHHALSVVEQVLQQIAAVEVRS